MYFCRWFDISIMKTILTYLLILTSTIAFAQKTCTSNPTTLAADIDFSTITWTASGGATTTECNNMADGVSTFTGNVVINIANGVTVTMDTDVTIDGNYSITNQGTSYINVPVGSDVVVTGDMGDASNNNVEYNVDGSLQVDGTLSGKNGNGFTGSGTVDAGALDFQQEPTCPTGDCPTISADTCEPAASTFCTTTVTPIILASFSVHSYENLIRVNWSTASEENNEYFTIERSSNGVDFHELAFIPGAGNSLELLSYSYTDNNPFEGVSYYRLKQTDYDGTSETFKIAVVEFYGNSEPVKIIQQISSPNEITVFSNLDEENTATVYDVMGRSSIAFSLKQGENTIDLSSLSNQSGVYYIRIVNALGKELKSERIYIK